MSSCHPTKSRPDYLLWVSGVMVALLYVVHWWFAEVVADVAILNHLAHSVFELMNTIWWGIALGVVMISLLGRVPREFVMSALGTRTGAGGIVRATIAGVLLDLCSHGILMVASKLYERGASVGQVMAFLIASPWNSFSFTLVLIALVGIGWTLLFVVASMLVAIVTGLWFERLVARGQLPSNPQVRDLPAEFRFWPEARRGLSQADYSLATTVQTFVDGLKESRMVVRWMLFGVLLAALVRALLPAELFAEYFGPTFLGIVLTLAAATVIEVCSEGSAPLAADLLTRAQAPGNGFVFLMGGVATDYTEIMVLKETTASWKIALCLPLLTIPQVLVIGGLMNLL
jgi:uncharacterized membrane protein YraQ (UPF0718 family)